MKKSTVKEQTNAFTDELYLTVLRNAGCWDFSIDKLSQRWNEPHRVYHDQRHLDQVLVLIKERMLQFVSNDYSEIKTDEDLCLFLSNELRTNPQSFIAHDFMVLVIAAFFHDAVYDTRANDNEERSADLMTSMCTLLSDADNKLIRYLIMCTKDHTRIPIIDVPIDMVQTYLGLFGLTEMLINADLHNLIFGPLQTLIDDNTRIFREYGWVDFSLYKAKRIEILENMQLYILGKNPNSSITTYIEWMKCWNPNIAVFPGSFDPFHLGHLDILLKAESIFDKVIIAVGSNPDKTTKEEAGMQSLEIDGLPNNQVERFVGLLCEYVKNKQYPVTVVKGLRNPKDFEYEQIQYKYNLDMDASLKTVFIMSSPEFEHMSSTGIRQLKSISEDAAKKFIFEIKNK